VQRKAIFPNKPSIFWGLNKLIQTRWMQCWKVLWFVVVKIWRPF